MLRVGTNNYSFGASIIEVKKVYEADFEPVCQPGILKFSLYGTICVKIYIDSSKFILFPANLMVLAANVLAIMNCSFVLYVIENHKSS